MGVARKSCGGSALGVLLWTCIVLAAAVLSVRRLVVVTLPPLCHKDRPLLSMGLFKTDFNPECLNNTMPAGIEPPSAAEYLRNVAPRTLSSQYVLPEIWDMNYATFNALILLMLGDSDRNMLGNGNATTCEAFWLGVNTTRVGLQMGEINNTWWQTIRSSNAALVKDRTTAFDDLLDGTDGFYDHAVPAMWALALKTSLETPISGLVNALADSEAPPSALLDIAQAAVDLVADGNETVCATRGPACSSQMARLTTLVSGLYLEAFVADLEAIFAADETAKGVFKAYDVAVLARFVAFLESTDDQGLMSVNNTMELGPMAITFFDAPVSHPLCVATAAAGLFAAPDSGERPCALTDVAFSLDQNRTEIASRLAGPLRGIWTLQEDLQADTGPTSCADLDSLIETSTASSMNGTLALQARSFAAHMCETRVFIDKAPAVATAFLVGETCAETSSLDACRNDFLSMGHSEWPVKVADAQPLCRAASRKDLEAQLPDVELTVSADELMGYRASVQDLWSACSTVAYLEMRGDSAQAAVLQEFFWDSCGDIGIDETTACAEMRQSLDLASAYFDTTLVKPIDLTRACERASASATSTPGFANDGSLKFSYFFLPCALLTSVCAFALALVSIVHESSVAAVMAPCMTFFTLSCFVGTMVGVDMSISATAISIRHDRARQHALWGNATSRATVFGAEEGCQENELCFFRGEVHEIIAAGMIGSCISLLLLVCALCCARPSNKLFQKHSFEGHKRFQNFDLDDDDFDHEGLAHAADDRVVSLHSTSSTESTNSGTSGSQIHERSSFATLVQV